MREIELFEVVYGNAFEDNFRRLTRKKHFRSLPDQIEKLANDLSQGKFDGDLIRHCDYPFPIDVYNLRLPNPDANAGKSNGYRVIYAVVTASKLVFVLAMYYKKEQASMTEAYVDGLLDGMIAGYLPAEADNGGE
jgi:mRNA-degrading endonuclease RelE of RelBE toxin-antitoxin system